MNKAFWEGFWDGWYKGACLVGPSVIVFVVWCAIK